MGSRGKKATRRKAKVDKVLHVHRRALRQKTAPRRKAKIGKVSACLNEWKRSKIKKASRAGGYGSSVIYWCTLEFPLLRNGARLNRQLSLLAGIIGSDEYDRHLLLRPLIF